MLKRQRLILVMLLLPAMSACRAWAALIHSYDFNEASGAVVKDITGYENGTLADPTPDLTGSGVLSLNNAQYVNLPPDIVSDLTSFTIEMWFTSNNAAWSRIFDFGSGTNSYMYFTTFAGSAMVPQFVITTSGSSGEQHVTDPRSLSSGVEHFAAVTLDASSQTGVLYIDGNEVASAPITLAPQSLGQTANDYLGRSQYSTDPYIIGSFDAFRIYNTALSALTIASDYEQGPDLPEPSLLCFALMIPLIRLRLAPSPLDSGGREP